jgi:hypothetical protein
VSVYVYALVDPRHYDAITCPHGGRIRYIGKTIRPTVRLGRHIGDAQRGGNTYRERWIRCLLDENLRPIMVILEVVQNDGDGTAEERYHIALAKADGLPLTNATDGGERGFTASEEVRARLSAMNKGKRLSPDHREKIRASHKARDMRPDQLALLAAARAKRHGTKFSLEERGRCAAGHWQAWAEGRRPQHTASSGYRGVYRNKKAWSASIKAGGRINHLGTFPTPEQAARAYDAAAVEWFGAAAVPVLNFPGGAPEPAAAPLARLPQTATPDGLTSRSQRKRVYPNNTSGYRGVRWKKGGWEVAIYHAGRKRHVGRYPTAIRAALAYDAAAAELLGADAVLNFPVVVAVPC